MDREQYKVVPVPGDVKLAEAMAKAAWLQDNYGVISLRNGFAIRLLSADYPEVIKMVRPDDHSKYVGKKWRIS
eukprot:12409908-Karenia_brevis.AAC.1